MKSGEVSRRRANCPAVHGSLANEKERPHRSENTEIERLNGRADVRNIASNKVLERCGFIKEGTIRQGKMVSVYCDSNIYGMLREDYAKID